jgi:replicative DNA helicase
MIIVPDKRTLDSIMSEKTKPGISTGLKDLDAVILGLRPAHLIIIAAYTGVGKSSLMADLTIAAARSVPVAVFSLEMGCDLFIQRMAYNFADLNYHRGISGDLSQSDIKDLKTAQASIEKLNNIYVNQSADCMYPSWRLEKENKPENSLEITIEKYYAEGCRVFLIDYIQYVNYGFKAESETLRIKELTKNLHAMAVKYSVPIIAFAQLKKEVDDKKRDPIPSLSDVRDSGYILNDSDIILLLHRPEYFQKKKEIDLFSNCVEDAQIIIAKQRSGPLGIIPVKFNCYNMHWRDFDSDSTGGI